VPYAPSVDLTTCQIKVTVGYMKSRTGASAGARAETSSAETGAPAGARARASAATRTAESAAKGARTSSGRRPYHMGARAEATQATGGRVLDAALALFTDHPYQEVSLEAVAERAQVTKQTVLRRFRSKEALFVAALQQAAEDTTSQRDAAPVGDIAGAVTNVVEHYERSGANRLRFLAQEDAIPIVAENVREGRAYHASWVERTFAPLLPERNGPARQRRLATLIALTDVYMWKLLRQDLKLSRAATERTLIELIQALPDNAEREL
jgi:AcrR family transcriptional regulator